ncbi:hypothetical protein V491_06917 [Pseudogymnoascus sp. VKM F-3775]|nr:hypothetical protein V491_06917 [Pseudogymnoascus sp. VKM F-3775]
MFALSARARFSNDPFFCNTNPPDRGAIFLEEGGKILNIRDKSLTTVQACVLLGAACTADGDDVSENLYHGIACRLAQLLDLPNLPVSCSLEREVNIRVWWSLCMVDVWSSTAVKLPKLMPTADVLLPMDEMHYLALRKDSSPSVVGSSELDALSPLVSEMIKLNRILLAINDFNETCVKGQPDGLLLEHAVHGLSRQLDDWVDALPESMRDTPENFSWYASHGLGRSFAAVYLGYYHFGQLLFYQFLHVGSYKSTPSVNTYAEKCKDHAARLCEMIYRAFSTPNCDVLYTMVAHVLVIASTVQIHTLLFSEDEPQIRIAHSRLEQNFKILLHLRTYWSTLDGPMMRLRAFHDSCRKSMETTFVLDRWMLRFLVEFAKPMEQKGVDDQCRPLTLDTLDFV